jgi:hypothetical protein
LIVSLLKQQSESAVIHQHQPSKLSSLQEEKSNQIESEDEEQSRNQSMMEEE